MVLPASTAPTPAVPSFRKSRRSRVRGEVDIDYSVFIVEEKAIEIEAALTKYRMRILESTCCGQNRGDYC
jgi:hypothetical protein